MLYTNNDHVVKSNSEYSAQIYPLDGGVWVDIIRTEADPSKGLYDSKCKLWVCVMHKHFKSRWFKSEPCEADYIAANNWVDEQFRLIEGYATSIITMPERVKQILE